MLPASWKSENLIFEAFNPNEAALAKTIYESCAHLKSVDPHFGEFPISEFQTHINNDCSHQPRNGTPKFYLRCIRDSQSHTPLGYLQFELDTPESNQCWLPMFVLVPAAQGAGVGAEAVKSLINQVEALGDVSSIGLNVYAENSRALRFWFHQGWREILGIELEEANQRRYTCITLVKLFN